MRKLFAQKRIIALLLVCILILSGCQQNSATETENDGDRNEGTEVSAQFDDYTEKLFQNEVVENTINLHYILAYPQNYGISDYDVSLGDFSFEQIEASYQEIERLKQELLEFDREELTKNQRLTYDILLDYANTELAAKDLWLYDEVLSPTTGYQAQLPVILAEYTFRTARDIEDYLSLISQMDDVFADIITFEKEKSKAGLFMPDYAAEAVIDQCEQFMEDPENNYMIEVFDDKIEDFEGISEEEKEAYRQQNKDIIITEVMDGYQILIDGLSELMGTGTNGKGLCFYEDGKAYYEYLVRTGTGSKRSVKELQKMTKDAIRDCMQNMAVTLDAKPEIFEEIMDYEFPITEPTAVLEDLNRKILEDFPEPPEVNYTVKSVHPSMEEHASPAFYLATPIDDITNNTIYINESYLGEDAVMDMYTTLAHEGYPGHLYQNAIAASANPAPIRSLFSCVGYSEGWATYVENYAYGISGLEENLANVLAWNNTVVLGLYAYADMGIHYDGWERSDLAEYLEPYGFSDDEIVNEMYEVIVEEPANYLNYFIGYLEVVNLRDEMKKAMGEEFVLKDFHEEFLTAGPAPFYILDDYLLDGKK